MNQLVASIIPWVSNEYGIHVQDHQIERITHDIEVFKEQLHLDDKQLLLKLESHDAAFVNGIINIFTVQESYFFRDQSVFNYLKEIYLPQLITRKLSQSDMNISIWSAGCCRGEELYTIAILLKELLPNYESWNITLLGTDIDKKTIEDAQSGIYGKTSLRMITPEVLNTYFLHDDNQYILKQDIRHNTQFCYQNLASDDYPQEIFDIIFCRNVMIYFSSKVIEKILSSFQTCLSDSGILILGPSDFISYIQHSYKENIVNGITFYEKYNAQPVDIGAQDEVIKENVVYKKVQTEKSDMLQEISKHIQAKNYDLSLKIIDDYIGKNGASGLLYQHKAQCLIFMGDIETANEYCDKSLEFEKNNYVICFYKALISMDKHDNKSAKHYFEKCITNNESCIESYYYLAHIYIREKELELAKNTLTTALKHSNKVNLDRITLTVEHFSYAKMIDAINIELKYLNEGISYG